jgi:hypothetical protein
MILPNLWYRSDSFAMWSNSSPTERLVGPSAARLSRAHATQSA